MAEEQAALDEADIPPPPPMASGDGEVAPPLPAMPHRDSRAEMLMAAKRASMKIAAKPAPAPPPKPKLGAAAKAAGGADFLKQGLLNVRLKKASIVNDSSEADLTGKRGRGKSREFLNFLSDGKKALKKVDVKALPSLHQDESERQELDDG